MALYRIVDIVAEDSKAAFIYQDGKKRISVPIIKKKGKGKIVQIIHYRLPLNISEKGFQYNYGRIPSLERIQAVGESIGADFYQVIEARTSDKGHVLFYRWKGTPEEERARMLEDREIKEEEGELIREEEQRREKEKGRKKKNRIKKTRGVHLLNGDVPKVSGIDIIFYELGEDGNLRYYDSQEVALEGNHKATKRRDLPSFGDLEILAEVQIGRDEKHLGKSLSARAKGLGANSIIRDDSSNIWYLARIK